jgi:hypothetical protein
MKWLGLILAITFTAASLVLTVELISNSVANQQNKSNYAELNHIKYGMLSVDEWKRQISAILFSEINHLDLAKTTERDLRRHLVVLLNTLIDKLGQQLRTSNTGSLGGRIKQAFIDLFISWDDIKQGVPEYVNAVMREIDKPQTKK